MRKKNILLITGGTGGHVIPAVNFGNYLIKKKYNCTLLTDKRGFKYVSEFKGKIIKIHSYHLGYSLSDKINFILKFIVGFFQSFFILLFNRPDKCLAFGGYATFNPLAILLLFKLLGLTEIYLHEQNSVLGYVNSIFLKFSKKLFLNFKNTRNIDRKYKSKIIYTGFSNNYISNKLTRSLKIKNKKNKTIFILGGSQGAVNLNTKICKILSSLKKVERLKLKVFIQCPSNQNNQISKILEKSNIKFVLKNYFKNIHKKLLSSDIVISRSGAGIINDIIVTNTPTIFVPLPISSKNHQYYNAEFLKNKNCAIIINENNLIKKNAFIKIKNFIKNTNLQEKLIKNLQSIEIFDTNKIILNEMNIK